LKIIAHTGNRLIVDVLVLFCRLFIEDDSAKMFVQRLEVGDSLGCGINDDTISRKVFFTRNGSTVSLDKY